jgi:hypothetical protein
VTGVQTCALPISAWGLWPAGARAAEAGGVKFPDAVAVGGQPLVLNGFGVRPRNASKVYAAALYTPAKTGSVADILDPTTPTRFIFTMLRDIKSEELSRMFSLGIESAVPKNALSSLIPSLLRMSQLFSEYNQGLRAGESCQFDWIPGTGLEITINDKRAGAPFAEPAFFQAMMRIWLGDKPADAKLKNALLGKS